MNNSSENVCPFGEWYFEAGQKAEFVVYDILTPIYGVIATLGHTLCLIAFYKQTKIEKAYMYQCFSSVSELLEVIFEVIYAFTVTKLAGAYSMDKGAYFWYRSCYVCMWWSCYLAVGVSDTFIAMSEFFAVAMSVDRFYALWKPISYRSSNSKNHQIVAVSLCVAFAIATSFHACFEYYLQSDKENGVTVYAVTYDYAFLASLQYKILAQMRNLSRAIGLLILYISNIGVIWMYRRRNVKAEKTLNKHDKTRKDNERILTLIAISQSCIVTGGTTCLILAYTADIVDPSFYACKGALYIPLVVASVQLTGLFDFISVFIISKKFREALYEALCCKTKNVVSSIEIHPNGV